MMPTFGGMEEESIGIKARLISMLLRLVTLGLIALALMISTEGIVIVLLLLCSWCRLRNCFLSSRAKVRRPHLDTDVGYALASPLMGLLTGFVAILIGLLSLAWVPACCWHPTSPRYQPPICLWLAFCCSTCWSTGRTASTMRFPFCGNSTPFIIRLSTWTGPVDSGSPS